MIILKIPIISKWLEKRSTLAQPDNWLVDWFSGGQTITGKVVNENTALTLTAVFACVRILAETIASLPLPVYRRLSGGGKERATGHYLYSILHDQPNSVMTSFELRETLMGHLCLRGNAYAEIERNNAGKVIGLWPLHPERMQVTGVSQKGLRYEYSLPSGESVIFTSDKVLHLRGLSSDGIRGYSPIRMAREAIGLAMATEEYGARFFANDSRPGGVLEHPGKLTDEAARRLKTSWEESHRGLSQSHRVAILEEGLKWQQIGIPPEDAQYLEVRKFQISEIARIFRVPLHLVNETDKAATYASVEQFALQFVVHTIRPWLIRWEQAIKRDLFLPDERGTYFAEFLVDGLLRGDIESRYRAYATGRQWGWLSADDIREKENMNPLPDGMGKGYLVPLNMMVLGESLIETEEEQRTEKRSIKLPVRVKRPEQYYPVFLSASQKLVKWEVAEIRKLIKKHLERSTRDVGEFNLVLDKWYESDNTSKRMKNYMLPAVLSYATVIADDAVEEVGGELPQGWADIQAAGYTDIYVRDHIDSSRGQIRILLAEQEPEDAIYKRLDEWEETRPEKITQWETVNAAGVFARIAFVALGVKYLRWHTASPKPCSYCQAMNGKVVGIDTPFALGSVDAEGEPPAKLYRNPRNPPLHLGCSCLVLPG